jgi:hypothetical protein
VYRYIATDLNNNVISVSKSAYNMAKTMGVTVDTIYKRIRIKVNKNCDFRKNNTKFNVIRERLK